MATSTRSVNLGKIGFNTRNWSSSTAYTANDFVVYENSLYTALTSVPAGTLPTDTNYFLCVSKGITPRGAYDSNETYDINDVVIYNNNAYWCKANGVTANPTDTTYWMQIPSPSLNAGFGIGNRYSVVPADSDLVGLWNLISANSVVDGTESLYGMTASTNVFRPIVTIVDQAPFHDSTIAYRVGTATSNKRQNDSGRHVSTSLCVFDTVGTVRTFRFLVYLTGSYSYNYLNFVTPSRVSSDFPSSNVYGFMCGVSGTSLWCGLRYNSNDRMFFNASSSDSNADFRYMVVPNDVNEFVFVVERTSTGYSYDSYVNGVKFRTGTSTYNYDATITDMYISVVTSNYPEYYSRGVVQMEVYNGAKVTAEYTPQYQLLSEPV